MRANETYFARVTFKTVDQNDEEVEFPAGLLWKATSFNEVVCTATGHVVRLPLHIARNPQWYFARVGDLFANEPGPKVSQAEYARELVRGNEGLDFRCLWDLGSLESWLPCATPPKDEHVFSACLSTHPHVQVMLEGVPVKGTKKERGSLKGYTYHAKRAA
jgi:hypothetical protein